MIEAEIKGNKATATVLPKGWRWVQLGKVCEFAYGSSLTEQRRKAGKIPVYGSNGIVGYHDESVTNGATIVIGRKGSIGEVNYSNIACWPIDTTYYVDGSKTSCNLEWLFFLLKSIGLSTLNKASGVPGLNRNDAYDQLIPLPPTLAEQERIVRILNEQMVAVEKAHAVAEARLEAAKALPAAYLRQVFPKPGQELPPGWRWEGLDSVCVRISNGTTKLQNTERLGSPVTRIETISSGCIDMGRVGWVELSNDEIIKYCLEDGDILFSHINSVEKLGNCAMFTGNETIIHGMNLLRLQLNRAKADPLFLLFFLRSEQAIRFFRDNARRAIGQASLNTKDLTRLNIPIPSNLTEQRLIASLLSEETAAVEKTVQTLQQELETINVLPAALLRRAFTGGL